METAQYNKLFSFIWNIANDVLVHAFEKGDYKKIILPFMVLRRIDVMLEPTKEAVLAKKEFCDKAGIANYEPFMAGVTGLPFYNTSQFTMKTLKNEIDPVRLKMNVIEYFNGFSTDVQDIIDKFKLRQQVDNLTDSNRLGSILEKFTDDSINLSPLPVMEEVEDEEGKKKMVERLPGLDNHTMGTIFEELLRKFNEENNVTEAGEHFTPRDYVRLLGMLALEPVKEQLKDNIYSIYDGACGTGGILSIAKEEFERIASETGKNAKAVIFGQELQPDTYATCKADLMISGSIEKFSYQVGTVEHDYISFGSTISQDGHVGESFDFCISNPPFGTPWKEDLKNWNLKDKKEVNDPRFFDNGTSFIPDIGDCQMLFLANNVSRMNNTSEMGTRIVEVHNGSSLFTGNAGGGESNLRRYIIENDLLEAIVAMPEKDFYNTGIGTYIWIITNRKELRRRGFVQLIDATNISTPLRKNLGEKNCETSEDDRKRILQLLMDFKETPESKIFRNEEFGYWQVPVLRPKRDDDGNIVMKKGKPVMKANRGEVEQIPLLYPGGIEAFYEKEVKPYDDEAEFGEPIIGYELSFTKYFYKPVQLRTLDEIIKDINFIGLQIQELQNDINNAATHGLNPNVKMKKTGIAWLEEVPEHWNVVKLKAYCKENKEKNRGGVEKQVLSLSYGRVIVKKDINFGLIPDSYDNYQIVNPNYIILRLTDLQNDHRSLRTGLVKDKGIITSAYVGLIVNKIDSEYTHLLLHTYDILKIFYSMGGGLRQSMSYNDVANLLIPVPPLSEQQAIVSYITSKTTKIDSLMSSMNKEIEHLKEYKQRLISDVVTGQIKVC